MRIGRLTVGVILMIIGFIVYSGASNSINEAQTFSGQIDRTFNESSQTNYAGAQIAQMAGGAVAIIGLVVTAAGAIGKKPKKSN